MFFFRWDVRPKRESCGSSVRAEKSRLVRGIHFCHFIVATREIAFIISISTAAVINEVAQQCQRSRIPGCSCDLKKEDNGNEDFQWGGCGDNVKFGEKEARRFINVFMNGNNARKAFHFHNSEVGRKVTLPALLMSGSLTL